MATILENNFYSEQILKNKAEILLQAIYILLITVKFHL